MPLFNFSLRPLEEVQPWGTPPDLSLSWFGLTDGIYWIDAGGEELFRYSDEFQARWPQDSFVGPYVDYQVIRIHEDLIDILPDVLHPLPDSLSSLIQKSSTSPSWFDATNTWINQLSKDDDDLWDLAWYSAQWVIDRSLTSLHLVEGPIIRIWRHSDRINLAWDNSQFQIDGVKVWSSSRGSYSLTVVDFRAEFQSFHDRLIDAMSSRIEAIVNHWDRPEIRIDLECLISEHTERRGVLEAALRRKPKDLDESSILDSLAQIKSLMNPEA